MVAVNKSSKIDNSYQENIITSIDAQDFPIPNVTEATLHVYFSSYYNTNVSTTMLCSLASTTCILPSKGILQKKRSTTKSMSFLLAPNRATINTSVS